jgi:sugar phosphate isomerase/epimerase
MRTSDPLSRIDRRSFVKSLAGIGAAAVAGGSLPTLAHASGLAAMGADMKDRIGLQLYTVRDLTAKDYPGTLMKVAQIGYKQVQTTGSYGDYTARQIHEFLDRAGLVSPATHVSPPSGADFEKTLEGYQLIGHKYTTVRVQGGGAAGAKSADVVKRAAEQMNRAGEITKKYGIKVIVHNHTEEFEPFPDGSGLPYDVLLAETDPDLVAMELDVGWASVAGQDILQMFRKTPGRFEVWHVKDASNLEELRGLRTQTERHRAAKLVPVGEGDVDYRAIFAQAGQAGMKYFFVEQDNAAASGDSISDARKSYQYLAKLLG